MIRIVLFFILISLLFSCTKEVKIDIPGYEENVVIDGQIEPNSPPFVILSRTKDIYAPTDIESYLKGFISGAVVTVSNGTQTVILDEICSNNLPPGTAPFVAQLFGIPESELALINFCAYTTFNTSVWGEIGKTYSLKVETGGETFTSSTTILAPSPLNFLFWKPDAVFPNYGFAWANLTDAANEYNAYMMEVKRINLNSDGVERDPLFTKFFSPVFDDEFFNGTTFEFGFDNPMSYPDETVPFDLKGFYKKNDSLVMRFSRVDKDAFEFLEKKYIQLGTAGNPFAVPTNIPSNIKGGALGSWIGYSPSYDTIVLHP